MIFESKLRRLKVHDIILLWLLDIGTAVGIAVWFEADALTLLFIFLGLEAFLIARQIIFGILKWISFALYGRRLLTSVYVSQFRMLKLPPPDEFEDSPEGYIQKVVENSECAVETRLGAAALMGEMACLRKLSGHIANLRISRFLEDAVASYKEQFPGPASA